MRLSDYIVIGYFLLFMVVLALVFRRFSKDTSDYFRGGGTMVWWMSAASGVMGSMSVWSLTGVAGAVYESGSLIGWLFISNALSLVVVYWFSCARFRRMRTVTFADAVRRRYGALTEQICVWVQMPLGLFFAAISLNAMGVFTSAVFRTDLFSTMIVVGGVVVCVAMLGGAWSVIAGGFIQMLLLALVLLLASYFALSLPEVGGLSGLIAQAPRGLFHWGQQMSVPVVVLWCIATFINQCLSFNNMAEGAARFLSVKNEAHAKKAALAMALMFPIVCVLLMVPPLAAAIVFPDLHGQFPQLSHPNEAAFVAICLRAMPSGVVGLLVAGIFALAMASMDTGLNRNAGLLVRNFYFRFVRPQAKERELLVAAKAATLLLGCLIVITAECVSSFRTLDLFNLVQAVGSLVGVPWAVATGLGFFVRRAPRWSGWSTAIVGLATAWLARSSPLPHYIAGYWSAMPPTSREDITLKFSVTTLMVVFASGAWFWLTTLFPHQEVAPVLQLFEDMDRPIDAEREGIVFDDGRQYRTVGTLCLVYGIGTGILAVLPALPFAARVSFLFCGGSIALVGLFLKGAKTAKT